MVLGDGCHANECHACVLMYGALARDFLDLVIVVIVAINTNCHKFGTRYKCVSEYLGLLNPNMVYK